MTDGFVMSPAAAILLVDLGISLPTVLRRAGLPQILRSEAAPTLTVAQYYALWQALTEESGDPRFPVRIAQALSTEAFDPPVFAALCSPDLTVAAARIARYKPLIGPLRLVVTSTGSGLRIETRWPEGPNPPEALVLTELLFWVALARLATRSPTRPILVTAPVRPAETAAYQDYLGVPIESGATPSIAFATQDAARPFLTANTRMWDFFEPELRRGLADMQAGSSMTELVRAALLRLLPSGAGTTAAVARDLAVSTRTLQRRLLLESTTFQAVLRETRESLAWHYLSVPQLRTAEISYLLGYEDTNSFYRAFHSWTGQTPERARTSA